VCQTAIRSQRNSRRDKARLVWCPHSGLWHTGWGLILFSSCKSIVNKDTQILELSAKRNNFACSNQPVFLNKNSMFKNFKSVEKCVFGKGAFGQLRETMDAKKRSADDYFVFLVDDVFQNHRTSG
jgi:hypothetical protein